MQSRSPIWAFTSLTIFVLLGVSHGFAEDKPTAAAVPLEFKMLDVTELPYPIDDREDLSVNCGGGKGVHISPQWVLTASHCITAKSQKTGKVIIRFPNADGKVMKIIGKKDNLRVTDKSESRGKAETSGGPWVFHPPEIGDVLIGVTHGGGRAPQVAYAAQWLEHSVRKVSNDELLWARTNQTLHQEQASPTPPAPPYHIKLRGGEDL